MLINWQSFNKFAIEYNMRGRSFPYVYCVNRNPELAVSVTILFTGNCAHPPHPKKKFNLSTYRKFPGKKVPWTLFTIYFFSYSKRTRNWVASSSHLYVYLYIFQINKSVKKLVINFTMKIDLHVIWTSLAL